MKKFIFFVLIIFLIVGCDLFESDKDAGDVSIIIEPATENYIWQNELAFSANCENENKVDYVELYVDEENIIEDHFAPFKTEITTNTWNYGAHSFKAIAVYNDDSETKRTDEYNFIACPIYSEDIQNINGITGRDAENNPIGNPDPDDWHFGYDNEITFGPAFPNPCAGACTIKFSLVEETTISLIVINSDKDLIDTIKDEVTYSIGNHTIQWIAPENISDLYRVIFHADENSHWHGDIEVQ